MMFAINAEKWRWEDVRREEVGEGEKRKLNFCHIGKHRSASVVAQRRMVTGTGSLAQPYEASILYLPKRKAMGALNRYYTEP